MMVNQSSVIILQDSESQRGRSCWKFLKFWRTRRIVVTIVMFFGYFNMFMLQTNLTVAIIDMTIPHEYKTRNGSLYNVTEFQWSSSFHGVVLSSYFYGSVFTHIIGGMLGTRYGGSTMLTLSAFIGAIFTFAVPELARYDVVLLILLRMLLGATSGIVLPCVNVIWSRWAPIYERTCMSSFAVSGCFFGNLLVLTASGIICKYLGWPAVFYITGYFSFCWAIVCGRIVKNSPEYDRYISTEELKYIKENTVKYPDMMKSPWKKFFTSKPVWAIIVAHFCANWGLFTWLIEFPTYLHNMFDFDLRTIGIVSSFPYLANALVLQISGIICDKLQASEKISITNLRKLFISTSFGLQLICILLCPIHPIVAVVCLTIAVGADGIAWCAFGVNHLDIAAEYSGILMGISCTFADIPGIVSPLIVGFIVTEGTAFQWQIVFLIIGGVYIFGTVFYCIFGSAERQDWVSESLNAQQSPPKPSSAQQLETSSNSQQTTPPPPPPPPPPIPSNVQQKPQRPSLTKEPLQQQQQQPKRRQQ